jgi:hypothetical protein
MILAMRTAPHRFTDHKPSLLILGCLILAGFMHAAKTDQVVLRNGNQITGEIRSLSRGKLEYKTDDMGTVSIEWDKITSIQSTTRFKVKTSSGDWYTGTFQESDQPGWMKVAGPEGIISLEMIRVVQIDRFESVFWQRLRGNVDLGFNLAKANDTTQFNFDFSLQYRGSRIFSRFNYSSFLSKQTDSGYSTHNYFENQTGLYFRPAWIAFSLIQLQQNEELNLRLRSLFGGGVGRYLIASNRMNVVVGGGVSAGSEKYSGVDQGTSFNSEAILTGYWEAFRYDHPKMDLTVSVVVFPSLSDWGRFRTDVTGKFRFELLKDFYLALGMYDYYDSSARGETDTSHDYGLTLSFSYSFH